MKTLLILITEIWWILRLQHIRNISKDFRISKPIQTDISLIIGYLTDTNGYKPVSLLNELVISYAIHCDKYLFDPSDPRNNCNPNTILPNHKAEFY